VAGAEADLIKVLSFGDGDAVAVCRRG